MFSTPNFPSCSQYPGFHEELLNRTEGSTAKVVENEHMDLKLRVGTIHPPHPHPFQDIPSQ